MRQQFIALRAVPLVILMMFGTIPAYATLSGTDYDSHLSKGVLNLNQKDVRGALAQFELAISENQNGVEGHYYLGVTHARANRSAEAETHFKKALSLDRTFIPARFDLGVLYYQIREDEKAMAAFKVVEKIDPARARVHYYQGIILRRNGEKQAGEAKLKKALSLDPGLEAAVLFQEGAVLYTQGAFDSAKSEFQNLLKLSPNGELAESAQRLIKEIDTLSEEKKRWDLSASLGIQYDDNVILEPSGISVTVPGITDKSDSVGIIYFRGRYHWLKKDLWRGDVEYRFFQNLHQSSLGDFNIQDHQLVLSGQRQIGTNEVSLVYELQYTFLGGDSYLMGHKLGPEFILRHSKKHVSKFSYDAGSKAFDDINPLFTNNSDRDVNTHQAELTHYMMFGEKGSLYAGYRYEREGAGSSAREDDWSFSGHRIKTGIVLPPWSGVFASFEANAVRRDYRNINEQLPGKKREDDDLLFIAVLSHPLTAQTTLSAQYLYQKNNSNIPVFEYKRNIIGLIVTAEY